MVGDNMKKVYPPLDLVNQTAAKYPQVWEKLEILLNTNGNPGIGTWPDWCYLPMAASLEVAKLYTGEGYGFAKLGQLLAALGPWRKSKEVYQFDPDLEAVLFEQDDLSLPAEILYQLPYNCLYISSRVAAGIIGFFAHLEYDINTARPELRFLFVAEDYDWIGVPVHLDHQNLLDSMDAVRQEGIRQTFQRHDADTLIALEKSQEKDNKFVRDVLVRAMQLVLYICAANSAIEPSPEQALYTRRSDVIKDRYSEIRKWDVGVRIGQAIRGYRDNLQAEGPKKEGQPNNPRRPVAAHIRRAHWHHFWIGPKKEPGERKLIVKWIPHLYIGGSEEDSPIVIHPVKK